MTRSTELIEERHIILWLFPTRKIFVLAKLPKFCTAIAQKGLNSKFTT